MKENYLAAYSLREKRNDLAEKFRKNQECAVQETQSQFELICDEIESLMDDDCIDVEFHCYDQSLKDPQRIVTKGKIIPSANEEYNRLFRFAVNYRNKVQEYTSVMHVHLYPTKRLENSIGLIKGAYRNQFVDDFVYETASVEMGIRIGNLKMNCYHTLYDEVIAPIESIHGTTIVTRERKTVVWYEGNSWYHTNRDIGEI